MPPTQKPPPIKTSPSRPGARRDNPPTPPRKTPPRGKEILKRNHSIAVPEFNPTTSTIYPGVIIALKLNVFFVSNVITGNRHFLLVYTIVLWSYPKVLLLL